MMKTRILSFLLALVMVLSLLPVTAFATDSTETTESTESTTTETTDVAATAEVAEASASTATGSGDGSITGWHPNRGSISVEYVDETMKIVSNSTPGVVVFTDRKFENYEMELEMQLNSGSWFGPVYRVNGENRGFYQISPGENKNNALQYHTSDGWMEDYAVLNEADSVYVKGTVMKVKVRVQDNKFSVYTMVDGATEYLTELNSIAIPEGLNGPGLVGIAMQYSTVIVHSVTIDDLDSDYLYSCDFSEYSDIEGTWAWTNKSGTVTTENGVMSIAANAAPAAYAYTGVNWTNYELEAEFSFTGQYAGLIFRQVGSKRGTFRFNKTTDRGINYTNGNTWGDAVSATTGFGEYTYGNRIKIKMTMQNNLLTVKTMMVGVDTDWFTDIENYDVTTLNEGALGDSGQVGFFTRSGSGMKVYSFKVKDTDTGYSYDMFPQTGTWAWTNKSGTVTNEDGVVSIAANAAPAAYAYTGVNWTNYELEAEFSFTGQYAGLIFRQVGSKRGTFRFNKTTSRNINYTDGNTWGDGFNTSTGFGEYTYGNRIKVKMTMQNNLLTVKTMMVGVDTEWFTDIENYDVTALNEGALGNSGQVGFFTRHGSGMKVYAFRIKNTDSGYTYDMLPQSGTWAWTNKSGTVTTEDGVMSIAANAAPAAYSYTGANWINYELEAEFSNTAQYAGITFRGNGSARGNFILNPTNGGRYVNCVNGNTFGDNAASATGFNQYTVGTRLRVKIIMKDNLLTIKTMVVGVDTDWYTDFENFDISTLNDGALGDSGIVGFFTRNGSGMKVYSFKITDTDTGHTYDLFTPVEVPITESVVFDGNYGVDTSVKLPQTPETIELWFKTDSTARQTLIHNITEDYGFYIETDASGKIIYHENNGSSNIDVASKASYNDGKLHKLVVRRYYDANSGIIMADLSVFTDNELVDYNSKAATIAASKKKLYEDNAGVIPQELFTRFGYFHANRFLFTGEIAEIRMWDYTLSDEKIAQVHTTLTGKEIGLLHCFVPENGVNFVDLVTSQTDNEITADGFTFWMDNYVLGDADYRIAVLGDIQQITEKYEISMREYFQWIRDHAEELNIKMVISMGDMVNTCTPEQMQIVSEASSVLDGVIPFIPLMGNHDYPNTRRSSELWNEYFPYEKFSQYDYFGGNYEEGKMENTYYLMNINGTDYMFMALEYAVRQEVVDWASEVIAAHPNHQVVVIEHNYLKHMNDIITDRESLQNTGISSAELYENLISKHDNIVMVLCGHFDFTNLSRRTDTTESGHVVHALGFDKSKTERYMGTTNLVGLLGFTNGSNTVQVNNYSITRDQFFRSSDQFTIELDWDKEYVPAPEIQVVVDEAMAQKVADAKEALYAGNASAYVQIANAGSVTSVVADKTFASDAKLNVFGQSVSAWYAEGDSVYVHILALGAADTVTLKGETDVVVQTKAFNAGKLEITTPADLDRSHYNYLLDRWYVTINGADQIALTSDKAVGESVIVYFDGAYQMMTVTEALSRKVVAINVAAQNYSGEIALIENDSISSGELIISYQGKLNVDGDLADWNENILATGRVMNGLYGTEEKGVTYYAYLADEGLYVAAVANHELYVNNAGDWYNNTNLEFYLNGNTVRLWITANPDCAHEAVQGTIHTEETDIGYRSVAEGFIPIDKLPLEALCGELKIGFAWKTPGDNIKHHNMTGGYDWWYLSRRHPSEFVEQYYVNASGIGLFSSTRMDNNIQLDGDFSDFNQEALDNKLSIYSQDGSVGFDAVAQYIAGNGIYVGIKAQSKTNPRPNDTDTWYDSTNLEFYVGENKYYITNRGAAAGYGLYGWNVYLDQTYDEATALYYTTMEFFIPESCLCTANYTTNDYVRMGFAFKPTGESVLLNGHTEATDYWHLYGHGPSDTANQFYIYDTGISLNEQANEVVSQQVSLGDDLTMNFVVDAYKGTTVNVTVAGETTSYDLSQMTANENGQYSISVKLAAAQMTENVKIQFVKNGMITLEKDYSIRGYAEAVLSMGYPAKTKNLVKWMLNYGAKAQQYFGVNLDNLANAGYEITESAVLPTEYEAMSTDGSISGIRFYGASLVFENQIAVRYYFLSDSVEGVTFTANGTEYEAVAKNGMYYVEVPGINPQDYSKSIVITATKGEENLSVSYSPLNYIVRMSSKGSDSLKSLLNALYGYHEAALRYVNEDVFFGTSGSLTTTSHFDLYYDNGANTGVTTVNENGIAFGYVDGFSEESFYMESKFHISSILATEAYPKFGLIVEAGNIREYFYVDMTTDLTATVVGRMTNTNNTDDWDHKQEVTVEGMSFSGEGETLTLGILKNGDQMHLFVNGVYVLTHTSSVSGEAASGVFGFNTGMTLSEYFTDTTEETINAKLALIPSA